MLYFILVSVGAVAILLFVMNVRAVQTPASPKELPMLDGSPHWVDATIASIESIGTYLGMTTARISVQLPTKMAEAIGPIPPRHEHEIVPGLAIRAHIEYDLLDTLSCEFWDSEPQPLLLECASRLGVEPLLEGGDLPYLDFEMDGHEVSVWLASDGWLTIAVVPNFDPDTALNIDLRADFEADEENHLLTERLGVSEADAREYADVLARLSPQVLQRIEAFAVSLQGWVCIADDAVEFECALPFPEGDLIARLVPEVLGVVDVIEASLGTSADPDGAW